MVNPFLGQIQFVGYNFAPRGWAECAGQLLPISGNSALFSLLGTTYGGDGRTTFALPDLRGRSAVGEGTGPGLSTINLGERGGAETKVLIPNEIPSHNHPSGTLNLPGNTSAGSEAVAGSGIPASHPGAYSTDPADSSMPVAGTTGSTGGGQSFGIRDPYLGGIWCIATVGVFPSRS